MILSNIFFDKYNSRLASCKKGNSTTIIIIQNTQKKKLFINKNIKNKNRSVYNII
jgi:hypothetical protein